MRHPLLMYGHDAALLNTRQMVLQRTGNDVFATTRLTEVEEFLKTKSIDLLVLCHTLSVDERKSTLALIPCLCAETKALVLVAGAQCHEELHATLDCAEGPRRLLATVEHLVLQDESLALNCVTH
jgi:hypothetical protein